MDDYITGVEQVGVDPTIAVETAAPVDPKEKVDPATDVYEFKEYDLKEYDHKEFVEKPYEYGDYGDYGTADTKPTSATYDDEFGPGVPAETDISVSAVVVRRDGWGRGMKWWSGMWKDGEDAGGISFRWLICPSCLLFLMVSGYSLEHSACTCTKHKYTSEHKHTHLVHLSLLQINRCRHSCHYRHTLHNLLASVTFAVYWHAPPLDIPPMICLDYLMTN